MPQPLIPRRLRTRGVAPAAAAVAFVGALAVGCSDGPATVEEVPTAEVLSLEPWDAGQGETVEVRIRGTGFAPGDVAVWERGGSEASDVVVRTTRYVSPTELVATVDVGASALADAYDVAIRNRDRKKGITTEVFHVLRGIGATLDAGFGFRYDGHRVGTFDADGRFLLDPLSMFGAGSRYAFTLYSYSWREQYIVAQQPRPDGWADLMMCWSPGGKVEGPGTRMLECWLEIGTAPGRGWSDDQLVEDSYSSFIGSDRPADGSGRITFTTVTPHRLAGTFTITMHADYSATYPGPILEVREGRFDVPVVSTYAFGQ
jgi:hypothetical protein